MCRDRLEALVDAGIGPAAALDYVAVTEWGYSHTAWADRRGVERPSVSENVARAKANGAE